MLSSTVRKELEQRTKSYRKSISTKAYTEFVGERISRDIQEALRFEKLEKCINKLNQIVHDTTWLFVIWSYNNYYSVLVFEGYGYAKDESIILGEINDNFASDDNIYIQSPASRKTFKSLAAVEAYIAYYYNTIIKEEECRALQFAMEKVYDMKPVDINETKFRESRAVIFDTEMMRQWNKSKMLPTITQLYNGKRYNRTMHSKKVIASLHAGRIIRQDDHYIVYWK